MRRSVTILVALAFASAALPSAALGQGNAGVDEYVEELPGAGGGNPGKGGDDPGSGSLPPAAVASLEDLGSDGAAAAALAQGSGPAGDGTRNANRPDPSQRDDGSGIAGDIAGTLTGSSESGMGIALPIVLVAALVAALAFLLVRHSRGRPGPT